MNGNTRSLLGITLVVASAGAVLWFVVGHRGATTAVEPGWLWTADLALADPLEVPNSAAAAEATPQNGETFLRGYWGDRYPEMEAALRTMEGWEDYDFSKLPPPGPFEEALPKLRAHVDRWRPEFYASHQKTYMGFGGLDDEAKIQKQFATGKELLPSDFAAIRAIAGGA